jgi:hypothetical protein
MVAQAFRVCEVFQHAPRSVHTKSFTPPCAGRGRPPTLAIFTTSITSGELLQFTSVVS